MLYWVLLITVYKYNRLCRDDTVLNIYCIARLSIPASKVYILLFSYKVYQYNVRSDTVQYPVDFTLVCFISGTLMPMVHLSVACSVHPSALAITNNAKTLYSMGKRYNTNNMLTFSIFIFIPFRCPLEAAGTSINLDHNTSLKNPFHLVTPNM